MPVSASEKRSNPRIVLYSHDTLGFGHLRRNIMLASHLRELPDSPDILLLAGMREAGSFNLPRGIDLVTLPAYAKQADGKYAPRHLGLSLKALSKIREATIMAAVQSFKPDLFIVDNVPRGAQNELDATLEMLRKTGGTHVVLGLRDVIDHRDKVRAQWVKQRNFSAVNEWFDEVWIYGAQEFYDLIAEYDMGAMLEGKARFTGYLRRDHAVDPAVSEAIRNQVLKGDPTPYIMTMVGGGRDGLALCKAFAQARLPEGRRGILVTGSQMSPQDSQIVSDIARDNRNLTVIDFLAETIALIDGADRFIGMGGYNTICEILSLNKDALIVPRATPRAEQLIRAERLAAHGLIDMLHPDDISADRLTAWMERPRRQSNFASPINMDGLENVGLFASEAFAAKQSHTYTH